MNDEKKGDDKKGDDKKIEVKDTDKKYNIDKEKLINTIPLIFTDKWGKGLTEVPANLFESTETVDNWLCQADAWDFDAFIQLSIFNEVIYG